MTQPILICRVSWMTKYQGLEPGKMYSGARYVREHGFGHEVYNFQPFKSRVFGFVQFGSSMHIERLGASKTDPSVSPITVI